MRNLRAEAERVTGRRVGELCEASIFSAPARRLLDPKMMPGEFLQRLLGGGHYVDGIRLMGAAMLPRRSVWWACLCARHVLDPDDAAERAAILAATRWVLEPTPARAKALGPAVKAIPKATPGRCAAAAAQLSGTTDDPGGFLLRPVTPNGAAMAAASVLLAAARSPAADRGHYYRQYLLFGLDVDAEKLIWKAHPFAPVSSFAVPTGGQ